MILDDDVEPEPIYCHLWENGGTINGEIASHQHSYSLVLCRCNRS